MRRAVLVVGLLQTLTAMVLHAQTTSVMFSGSPLVYPYGMALSPDETTLYITDFGARSIFQMPATGGTPQLLATVGDIRELTVSPDGQTLYVAGFGRNDIFSVSVESGLVTQLWHSTPLSLPHGIAVSPDGETLYVADSANGVKTVFSYSLTGGGPPTPIADCQGLGAGPYLLEVSADGQTLYIAMGTAIYSVATSGGTPALLDGPFVASGGMEFVSAPSGDSLLFVDCAGVYGNPSLQTTLYRLTLAGGREILHEGYPFDRCGIPRATVTGATVYVTDDDFPASANFVPKIIRVDFAPELSCVGFESPMGAGPVTVRGNRALPLKAQLFDGENNLVSDLEIAAPPVIQVWYEYGTPDAEDVTDEALPAGESSEGNQFSFDSDQRWHYNLKTKNYSASGTYTVFMDSGDASEYLVEPTCTGQFVVR